MELLEDRKGKSKGAAVVEFREKESVQRCVDALHRYPMNDRLLTAKEIRVIIFALQECPVTFKRSTFPALNDASVFVFSLTG